MKFEYPSFSNKESIFLNILQSFLQLNMKMNENYEDSQKF